MTSDIIARGIAAQARTLATPRIARPRIALLGDSRLWSSHGTANGAYINSYGLAFHIVMQTGGRVDIPQRLNFAVGGITTGDINSRTFSYIAANTVPSGTQSYAGYHPQALASAPGLTPVEAAAQSSADMVIYLCSTNDRTSGVSAAISQANVALTLARLRAAGKIVILVAEMPRGDTSYSAKRLSGQQLSYHLRMAQWLRNVRMPGVYVVDPWPILASAGSASGDALVDATYDGLHPAFPAAYQIGRLIADVISPIVPPFAAHAPASSADLWSTDNPSGALNGNPMLGNMNVTPQAASGVTISGQLPANWQHGCINLSGVTIAYGSASLNGVACLSVALSGTPTSANPRLDIISTIESAAIAGIATGDVLQTSGPGYVQAGASGYSQFSLHQLLFASGNASYVDAETSGSNVAGSVMTTTAGSASGAWGGPFATESCTYGGAALGTSTQIAWRVYMNQNVPVSATFLIGPTALRKIV